MSDKKQAQLSRLRAKRKLIDGQILKIEAELENPSIVRKRLPKASQKPAISHETKKEVVESGSQKPTNVPTKDDFFSTIAKGFNSLMED